MYEHPLSFELFRSEIDPPVAEGKGLPCVITGQPAVDRIADLEREVVRLRSALAQRTRELETLFNVVPICVGLSLDSDCKHIQANGPLTQVLQLEPLENASKTANQDERPSNFACVDLAGKRIPDDQLPMQIAASQGIEVRDFKFDVIHENGRIFRLHAFAAPLFDAEGRPRGSIGAAIDVSEQRTDAERERQRLAEIAHLGRLSTLGELVSEVAHEVNQPLAAASNFARASLRSYERDGLLTPLSLDLLKKTIQQIENASQIVKRLTSFVRKSGSALTSIDLNDLISDVVALTKSYLYSENRQHAPIFVSLELADDLKPVLADPLQIQQVIVNILRNAIEATQAANSSASIVVATSLVGESIRVSVADGGNGVDPTEIHKIFDPFYTTKPNGIGLGLSISRSIIENLGGRLGTESNGGCGAIFSFELPVHGNQQPLP